MCYNKHLLEETQQLVSGTKVAIRAVFFDFMGTLAHYTPEQEELLVSAAHNFGLSISLQSARKGFAEAGEWWNQQVSLLPLQNRSRSEKEGLYRAFDLRILQAADVHANEELAGRIFQEILRSGQECHLEAFEDAVPALQALREQGIRLGVISNMGRRLPQILSELRLDHYFGAVFSSGELGVAKPHPGIFRAAADRSGVVPEEALHVGDQYEHDVLGARSAGLTPVLLDRYDLFLQLSGCLRVQSLEELPHLVAGMEL